MGEKRRVEKEKDKKKESATAAKNIDLSCSPRKSFPRSRSFSTWLVFALFLKKGQQRWLGD